MSVAVLLLLLAALVSLHDVDAQPDRHPNSNNGKATPTPAPRFPGVPVNDKGKFRCDEPAICSVSTLHVQFFGIEGTENFTASQLVIPATARVVQVSRTSFSGRIDDEFVRKLANVSLLDLSDNRLDGTLPASIGQLTNLRALTIDGNFFYGRVPDLSRLTNLQVCVLSDINDTNQFCCPSAAEMPPMAPCRCHNAPSCTFAPATYSYAQLVRLWAAATRMQVLAMRRSALQALIALLTQGDNETDDDENSGATKAPEDKRITAIADSTNAAAKGNSGNGNGNGNGSDKKSTRKVNAKLVDSKGQVVAFELDDGTVAEVRRTELASDGSIAGYELEDGSFIAASDATDAMSKSSGLSKKTIIIIGAVSGAVALVLCIAGAFVLFHWQQRATDDDDDDLTAAANASPVDDSFGLFNGTDDGREQATDAELRPVKRARKHHAPREDAHALDALDLPGTLASPIGVPRQHGSDEGLLAPKHSSGDSLPGAATRANLAGYVAPPSPGSLSGTAGWNHGSDEALKAPKHSSGDAMPGAQTRADLMRYVPGAEVDEQSVLDGTPQLYFSPGKDSSPLESPFSDNYAEDRPGSSSDHGLYEASSSSSSGEQRPNGFQLYLHSNNDDGSGGNGGDAVGTPSLESASASEAVAQRGTKRRAANKSRAAEQHFSNIKLPNELKPARKKKPAHLRKHANPVEDFDNIVLPAEMRGRKTIVIDEEASA